MKSPLFGRVGLSPSAKGGKAGPDRLLYGDSMKLSSACSALGLCAVALLEGCGISATPSAGRQPMAPLAQIAAYAAHPDRRASWMAAGAKENDLLYVSDVGTGDVYVYSYPQGALVGTLTGFTWPAGLCVDSAGDVYVTDLFAFHVLEYAHGGTYAIATLKDPGEDPGDCAFDPATGNLAVANVSTPNSNRGDVLIYTGAKRKPHAYKERDIFYYEFCAYDDGGNLYVDGVNHGVFALAEIPSGQTGFTNITLDKSFAFAGALAWDGGDLAVGDYESKVIYEFSIGGDTGKEVRATHLKRANFPIGSWIQGSTVIGPNDDSANVMFWRYPKGGLPFKTIGGLHNPWGSTVSRAIARAR